MLNNQESFQLYSLHPTSLFFRRLNALHLLPPPPENGNSHARSFHAVDESYGLSYFSLLTTHSFVGSMSPEEMRAFIAPLAKNGISCAAFADAPFCRPSWSAPPSWRPPFMQVIKAVRNVDVLIDALPGADLPERYDFYAFWTIDPVTRTVHPCLYCASVSNWVSFWN